MKAILEFDLHEEREEFDMTMKARDYYCALLDTAQEVFRPYRKHGYADQILQKMIENPQAFVGELGDISDVVYHIIEKLESKYYDILTQHGVEL